LRTRRGSNALPVARQKGPPASPPSYL